MALNEYLRSHPNLRDEIERQTGSVEGIEEEEAQAASMDGDCNDDVDISSADIIHDALGFRVSESDSDTDNVGYVSQVQRDSEHGGLVAAGEEENVWAWNNGEKWGDELLTEEEDN
ncbi:hypothetical protein PILCRDRAFT_12147 [Piloderma croceum F 1598]|uniref:Uncharacterized protein n=1 Tax=Piloderma croceum (strain F 1598) TaxID=765440 RepID=A0A0C3FBT0_PILCF|nr:hypothetical protein PILCRDRAFT_12147 [Piloderma croceum F 1598]